MGIAEGIASVKAAADLAESLREAAKSGALKPDEFVGRVNEIYDYIINSRAALTEAQEEIAELKAGLTAANDDRDFRASLKHDPAGLYRRQGPHGEEVYCSACLDLDRKRIRARLS